MLIAGIERRPCLNCSIPFKPRENHIKFCSKICYWEYRKNKAAGIPKGVFIKQDDGTYKKHTNSTSLGHNFKTTIYKVVECSICGKSILRQKSKKHNVFCCSKKCKSILRSAKEGTIKHKRGKNGGHILECRPDHPNAKQNYVPTHRLIVEERLGRYLTKEENVHHIDFDPRNNTDDNLVVVTQKEHSAAQVSIYKLAKDLIRLGIIYYDKEQHRYLFTDKFKEKNNL